MSRLFSWIESVRHKRLLRHANALADRAEASSAPNLDLLERRSRQLRKVATRLEQVARSSPQIRPIPARSDWSHRPGLWTSDAMAVPLPPLASGTRIDAETTLHHDASHADLCLAHAKRGVTIDALGFDGSYVSLAVPFPQSSIVGLSKEKVIGLAVDLHCEADPGTFGRLNVRHGPNTEQLVREIPVFDGQQKVEFDIFFTAIDPSDIREIWLDLIFRNVQANQILIRDLVMFQRARANV